MSKYENGQLHHATTKHFIFVNKHISLNNMSKYNYIQDFVFFD